VATEFNVAPGGRFAEVAVQRRDQGAVGRGRERAGREDRMVGGVVGPTLAPISPMIGTLSRVRCRQRGQGRGRWADGGQGPRSTRYPTGLRDCTKITFTII
jgi:hypothetical protein